MLTINNLNTVLIVFPNNTLLHLLHGNTVFLILSVFPVLHSNKVLHLNT